MKEKIISNWPQFLSCLVMINLPLFISCSFWISNELESIKRLRSVVMFNSDFGFDPLGLGEVPENLERFKESELIHCRWAMLAVVSLPNSVA